VRGRVAVDDDPLDNGRPEHVGGAPRDVRPRDRPLGPGRRLGKAECDEGEGERGDPAMIERAKANTCSYGRRAVR
jgi:hypothetical protein